MQCENGRNRARCPLEESDLAPHVRLFSVDDPAVRGRRADSAITGLSARGDSSLVKVIGSDRIISRQNVLEFRGGYAKERLYCLDIDPEPFGDCFIVDAVVD